MYDDESAGYFDRRRRLGDEIETTMKARIVITRKGNTLSFFSSVDRLLKPAVRCSAAGTDRTGGTGDGQCALIQDSKK